MSDSGLSQSGSSDDWKEYERQRAEKARLDLIPFQELQKQGGYESLWDVPGYQDFAREAGKGSHAALKPENRGFPRYEDDPIGYMIKYCNETYRKTGTPTSNPECIPFWKGRNPASPAQGLQGALGIGSVTHTNPANPTPKAVVALVEVDEPTQSSALPTQKESGGGRFLKFLGGVGLLTLLGYGSYRAYRDWDKIKARLMKKG